MPRFAANLTMMFADVPFPARFERAARAGFRAVEFLFPYDHAPADVAGWLRDNGLENALFNLPPGDWSAGDRGLAAVPGREAEFRSSVDRALRYADALGTPTLHAMAGVVPHGADRAAWRRTYVENLRYAAKLVGASGRTLVIEAINPRDMPGYLVSSQTHTHAVRDEVGDPALKIQMDFYHAQIVDGDLEVCFRTHRDAIAHVQIAAVPSRHEPDEGEVNYRHLFGLLDALHYGGWVGCEYHPRARTEDGLGWMRELTHG
jgi:hydroxypyruvate isomerase